jgi:hypothetical protein
MPRRPKKGVPVSKFPPGVSGNPNGRPKGSVSEINKEIKEAFAMLLQKKIPELETWLTKAAEKNPIKALEIFTAISERFVPSLSRTEHTGADGEALASPIQITIPAVNLIQNNNHISAIPANLDAEPLIQQPRVLAPPADLLQDTISDSKVSEVSEVSEGDVPDSPQEVNVPTSIGEGTPEGEVSPVPWVLPKFELPPSALKAKEEWEAAQTPGISLNPPRS